MRNLKRPGLARVFRTEARPGSVLSRGLAADTTRTQIGANGSQSSPRRRTDIGTHDTEARWLDSRCRCVRVFGRIGVYWLRARPAREGA